MPSAWVSATTSGCCQSVMNPGCTSVSTAIAFSGVPGWKKRMPASVMSIPPPTLRKMLRKVAISFWEAPRTKTSPWVTSAAQAHEAASMRSGSATCSYPPRRSTPSIVIVRSVCREMIAPIFCRTAMRSSISGSTAALVSSVTPSARTAVSSTCSVAPTLGYSRWILVPLRPLGAVM